MLLLTPHPAAAALYPDHREAARFYAVPDTLAPATGDDGAPRFFLLRYGGDFAAAQGGVLQMTAALGRSDRAALPALLPAGAELLPAPLSAPALRLVLRTTAADTIAAAAEWQPVAATDGGALTVTLLLDAHAAQLLHVLIDDAAATAAEVLELELRFVVAGLVAGLPWSVTVDGPTLRAQLDALLPDGAATAEQIQMAFRSLPADVLTFTPHAGGAGEPAADALLAEQLRDRAAHAALSAIFRRVADGYQLHPALLPTAAGSFGWSLAEPLPGDVTHTLRWSISALHRALGDDARFFPVVSAPAPLARATLHIINALPLAADGIAQVVVELRYRNRLGNPTHETLTFDVGGSSVAQREVIFPAFGGGLALAYRLTCFIARPGGFPLVWPPEPAFTAVAGTVVTIDRAAAGLRPLHLAADAALWPHVAHIDCAVTVGDGAPQTVTLSAAAPTAWRVLTDVPPNAPLHATAVADSGAGASLTLHDGALHDDRLRLHAWQIEPTAPDLLTVQLTAAAAAGVAFAAAELRPGALPAADDAAAEGTLLTLDGERPRTWQLWRDTLLAPLRYAWRLRLVRRNADGSTQPLQQTPWQPASAPLLLIDLPP